MIASTILSLPIIRIGKYIFFLFFLKDFAAKLTLTEMAFCRIWYGFLARNGFWAKLALRPKILLPNLKWLFVQNRRNSLKSILTILTSLGLCRLPFKIFLEETRLKRLLILSSRDYKKEIIPENQKTKNIKVNSTFQNSKKNKFFLVYIGTLSNNRLMSF